MFLIAGLFSSSPKQCSQQQLQQQQQQQNDSQPMQFVEPVEVQKNHTDDIVFNNR